MAEKDKYGDKNIGIDIVEFKRKAKKLAKQFELDEKEFIKDQSRLLAREAAIYTPPWAGDKNDNALKKLAERKGTAVASKADIQAGENAIKGDIKRICLVVDGDAAWSMHRKFKGGPVYKKGNVVLAPRVITNGIELYRWHQEKRLKNGRTTDRLKIPNLPIVGRSLIEEYIQDMQRHVGVAKASLLKAAIDFGDKGAAPPKIKRHLGKATGSGKLNKKSKGYEGLVHAIAEGTYTTKRFIPHLMRNRLEKAHARLKILAREAAKKAEFKTT